MAFVEFIPSNWQMTLACYYEAAEVRGQWEGGPGS